MERFRRERITALVGLLPRDGNVRGDGSFLVLGAAIALATFSAGGPPAAAQQCTRVRLLHLPMKSAPHAHSIGATRITFFDRAGNVMRFEKCVGRIFAAARQPDPYKTGQVPSGDLQMPAVEMLEPSIGHSD